MSQDDPEKEDRSSDRNTIILLAVLVEGGLVVLSWGVGWLLHREPLETLSWNGRDALWGLAATVPMLAVFLLMLLVPFAPVRRVREFSERIIRPLLAPCTVIDLLGISVLAGLGEEMLFRGVWQGLFDRWLPHHWPAIALASVLFGILHAITPTYAVFATLMGAYLGWLWLYTGNLLTPIIAHALYDFLVLLYLLRGPGSKTPLPPEDKELPLETDEESSDDDLL